MRVSLNAHHPLALLLAVFLTLALLLPPLAGAQTDGQIDQINNDIEAIKERLNQLEKENQELAEDKDELQKRLDKTELHTATDKLSFGVDFRTRADTLHYNDIRVAPSSLINGFFTSAADGGFNGATLGQIQQGMANMAAAGMVPPPDEVDADNDIIYTNRLRLEMRSKVNDHVSFYGRMAAYKVFGDSSGVKFNQGSLGDVTLDGNTSSLPHGDMIRMERAFFNLHRYFGSVPVNFSLGRRPSTEGPPLELRNNSLEGGSPLATLINWQFDGASLNFGLEDVTHIPGAALKLCYGVGFEGDWGNASSLSSSQPSVDDVHMFGFIADLYNDELTSVVLNYAHAWDVTDGFTGLTVMPFIVSREDRDNDGTNEYYFEKNNGGFITRMEPTTNIGDWDALSLLLRSNLVAWLADIDLFVAGSWSHTDPSRVSRNPFYEITGTGLLSSGGDLKERDGYSLYAGVAFPMPLDARLGLEYNWGSKYWLNFSGAEDSLVGSKLAARGQVYEAYYHQPVYGPNFFLTLGTQYYDYAYTGSGNPLGKPIKISEASSLDTLNAVVDTVWVGYLSATLRF
ncbi:MAG: DUF3373 family protein [Desulfosarcinaceae bacterium]